MNIPGTRLLLLNAAAGLVTLAALFAVVRSFVFTPAPTPCSERYMNSTTLPLERGGAVLTGADLQASLGGRDVGVIDNVTVAPVKNAPAALALMVDLPQGSASPVHGGMSFPWQPRAIQNKSTACLSYNLLLPADFQFTRGGMLPGIMGSDETQETDGAFKTRMVWRQGGNGGVNNRLTNGGQTTRTIIEGGGFALPRGRWFKVEQEATLNTPKQSDGILRLWIDGELVVDRNDIVYRTKPSVTVSGVAADVHYGGDDAFAPSPKDTKVLLSPFVLRWM
jgi:hypothetical protein